MSLYRDGGSPQENGLSLRFPWFACLFFRSNSKELCISRMLLELVSSIFVEWHKWSQGLSSLILLRSVPGIPDSACARFRNPNKKQMCQTCLTDVFRKTRCSGSGSDLCQNYGVQHARGTCMLFSREFFGFSGCCLHIWLS